ncbi:caspase family protein [Alphaproteobacteria bacterium]|nr:caspase family protein [Alphaproteobacteria bacterium]
MGARVLPMMMTRFVLTLLVGLVVSLGALVSGVEPVLAKNWNLKSDSPKPSESIGSTYEGVNCQPKMTTPSEIKVLRSYEDSFICDRATGYGEGQKISNKCFARQYVIELRLRNIDCGLGAVPNVVGPDLKRLAVNPLYETPQIATTPPTPKSFAGYSDAAYASDYIVCDMATLRGKWDKSANYQEYVQEAKRRGLSCGVGEESEGVSIADEAHDKKALELFGKLASGSASFDDTLAGIFALAESERKTSQPNDPTEEQLKAERLKRIELERKLAALEAEKATQQQTISGNTSLPTITIASASSNGPQGTILGRVSDSNAIAEVRVDGQLVQTDSNGNFTANTYVPEGGVSVSIQAVDLAGLSSSMSVRIDRAAVQTAAFRFDRLNPLGRKVARNKDAVAIIVGVSDYKETTARAAYADSDAKAFQDYATEKLGVPRDRIKTLVNDGADEKDMLLAVKRWLARASKRDKTDVYIFFAGHGLASDDGQKMYLLPYDGAPELLDDTAILRERLFSDIASANPRSVTVFLDTCYSGTTRGTDMLIASRPIAIKALKQSIPDNFTVMTAARGDQTAKPLEEAKHGMFSYFLMKGMEGEADANQDNKITAGELHSYVQSNVIQQSSGSQTPELQGDAERVLVRFQ